MNGTNEGVFSGTLFGKSSAAGPFVSSKLALKHHFVMFAVKMCNFIPQFIVIFHKMLDEYMPYAIERWFNII